jgi:hypothetical protein
MSRLDENLGGVTFDNLINQNYPPADVFSVSMRAGLGVVTRGTVLALSTGTAGDNAMVILGTAAVVDETLTANCVLAEDVDTGDVPGAAVHALAYRTGHFNRNAITVKDGYTLSAANEEDLRKGGILLSDALAI